MAREFILAKNTSFWQWEDDENERIAEVIVDERTQKLRLHIREIHTKSGLGAGTRIKVLVDTPVGTRDDPDIRKILNETKKHGHPRGAWSSPFKKLWVNPSYGEKGPLSKILQEYKQPRYAMTQLEEAWGPISKQALLQVTPGWADFLKKVMASKGPYKFALTNIKERTWARELVKAGVLEYTTERDIQYRIPVAVVLKKGGKLPTERNIRRAYYAAGDAITYLVSDLVRDPFTRQDDVLVRAAQDVEKAHDKVFQLLQKGYIWD